MSACSNCGHVFVEDELIRHDQDNNEYCEGCAEKAEAIAEDEACEDGFDE